jgi:hypothetical protein
VFEAAPDLAGDRHREGRKAVHEAGGAVERSMIHTTSLEPVLPLSSARKAWSQPPDGLDESACSAIDPVT